MPSESEPIIEMAPKSCSTSSAAMVWGLSRLSAKATSSGTSGLKPWHSIIMSRCSSNALRVNGLVGLVDDGRQWASPLQRMMLGAWPPPAPSVWYMWMVRPAMASMVRS